MMGIGGTGVVTISQVVGMAALIDGLHVAELDQTGLSQKGGPVTSDMRISREPLHGLEPRSRPRRADLYLGFDVLGASNPKNLAVADPERTVAVVSTAAVPTGAMVLDPGARLPAGRRAAPGDRLRDAARAATCTSTRSGSPRRSSATTCRRTWWRWARPGSAARCRCRSARSSRRSGSTALRSRRTSPPSRGAARASRRRRPWRRPCRSRAGARSELSPVAVELVDGVPADGELRRILELRVPS